MSKDLEYFRNKLLALKKEAEERLQATENDETLESLALLTERELQQINAALARIDEGSYFNCSECGAPIPEARLELLPFTTLCVQCAELLEKRQRGLAT